MAEDQPSEWLYDYTLQFLASPGWKIPIMSFIDEKCWAFDNEDENKFEYTTIHKEFEEMVDNLLENICIELGATHEMFYKTVKAGIRNPKHKKFFEQILATVNFMSFKKLMVKRNKELELEALQMMHNEGYANVEEVEKAMVDRDQAEIEHAIAVSIAAEAERKRLEDEEEEMIRRVMQESESEYKKMVEAEKAAEIALANEIKNREKKKVADMEQEQKRKYEEQKKLEAEEKKRDEEEYNRQQELIAQNKRVQEETRRKLEAEQQRLDAARAEEEKLAASRKEAKRIEEEAKKREMEKNLPPVVMRKAGNVDLSEFKKLDVSEELKESAELDEINKKIAAKYSAKPAEENKGGESLEERTTRLRKQREMLLKKKQEERANEMQKYISNGGTDLSAKKGMEKLPPVITEEELEKRRNVINRLRASDLTPK